ncbi:MAG: PilZ domain-containing protein [bacterium]|nr:PilZ domain-containing protein [bacterium]
MKMHENRRKNKRLKFSNLAKINEEGCSVINISRDGILLSGEQGVVESGRHIKIQLKIRGHWVELEALVVWIVEKGESVSMGIFITSAPREYTEFIENLYLEADQK